MTASPGRPPRWLRTTGVGSMMLGLLWLGLSIPHAGRSLVTELAMLNLFWQAGIGLLVAGTILIGLSWLNSR